MDSRPQENGEYAQPEEETFQGFRNRLEQATDELRRIVQKHEHALKLSMITALPMTEAYQLVSRHGLDLVTTVADLFQDGCSVTQALLIATQGAEEGGISAIQRLAVQQRFSLSRFEAAIQPTVCWGCRHYYGRVDGMNRLICAMHPYGPETDDCEDWEATAHHL